MSAYATPILKKIDGRYKRIRKRVKGKPNADIYTLKVEALTELEHLDQAGHIDLYYGDATGVSQTGYVPYAWQFRDEDLSIPVTKGKQLNCFALVKRTAERPSTNDCYFNTTKQTITAAYVLEQLDAFSFKLNKPTVVVLDQARVHTARKIKERLPVWQRRGLYVFYLPTYSPHLNIAEILWRFLKYYWLKPSDYESADRLFYTVKQALSAFGQELTIAFRPFNYTPN